MLIAGLEKTWVLLLLCRNSDQNIWWSQRRLQEYRLVLGWCLKWVRSLSLSSLGFCIIEHITFEHTGCLVMNFVWTFLGWIMHSLCPLWGCDQKNISGLAFQTRNTLTHLCGPTQTQWSFLTGTLICQVRSPVPLESIHFSKQTRLFEKPFPLVVCLI